MAGRWRQPRDGRHGGRRSHVARVDHGTPSPTDPRPLTSADVLQRLRQSAAADLVAGGRPFDPGDDRDIDRAAALLFHRFREDDDVAAYTLLIELCQPRLRRLAATISRPLKIAVDPDDLVAGFMAKLFTDLRRDERPIRRFLGMAYTAMRYDALNQLRLHERAQRRCAVYAELTAPTRQPVDPAKEVDGREQAAELRRVSTLFFAVVLRCFHSLRGRERRVLEHRELQALSYGKIAEVLGVPRAQVGMVLKRARDRLSERIAAALRRTSVQCLQPATKLRPPRRPRRRSATSLVETIE